MSTGRSPDGPHPGATSVGLARLRIVGPEQGAVHTELAVGALDAGGWLAPHVHSFEEALYVLEGELLLDLGGQSIDSRPGDFALIPTGPRHALGNAGGEPVRLLSLNTPQRSTQAPPTRHVLRAGRTTSPRWRPRRPARRSATRRSASSATTRARRPGWKRCA